jgi:hypothetical protein
LVLNAEKEFGDLQAYDDLCARVYTDSEIPHGTRELAVATAWLNCRDPARHTTSESTSRRLAHLLGRDRTGHAPYRTLFAADAPRYERPRQWWGHEGSCEGPRVRAYRPRGGAPVTQTAPGPLVCGDRARIMVEEWNMVTGRIERLHWFCRRHAEHADRVRAQVSVGNPPLPVPNTGGFLPRYFRPEALVKIYARCRPGWNPPVYGLCRDDWPTAEPMLVPKRPRLALVVGSLPELDGPEQA